MDIIIYKGPLRPFLFVSENLVLWAAAWADAAPLLYEPDNFWGMMILQ